MEELVDLIVLLRVQNLRTTHKVLMKYEKSKIFFFARFFLQLGIHVCLLNIKQLLSRL